MKIKKQIVLDAEIKINDINKTACMKTCKYNNGWCWCKLFDKRLGDIKSGNGNYIDKRCPQCIKEFGK